MIEELDQSLERWLRAAVPLPDAAADIRFEQPERDWDARRSTPLVSLFLYGVTPAKGRAATGERLVEREGGGLARVAEVPVITARYLVSVWGGGSATEHDLLGGIMALLAAQKAIPEAFLGPSLAAARPRHTLAVGPDEETTAAQLWSALSVPPRPAVQLRIDAPLALPEAVATNDPPTALSLTTGNRHVPAARSQRRRRFGRVDPALAGERVVGPRGSAVISDSGRYAVEADLEDELHLPAADEQGGGGRD